MADPSLWKSAVLAAMVHAAGFVMLPARAPAFGMEGTRGSAAVQVQLVVPSPKAIPDEQKLVPAPETPVSVLEESATVEAIPDALSNPPLGYPSEALRRRWEGRVVLEVLVLASGECGGVRIRESSGRWILDQYATAAVRRWRFRPARQLGHPVDHWATLPIRFRLAEPSGKISK